MNPTDFESVALTTRPRCLRYSEACKSLYKLLLLINLVRYFLATSYAVRRHYSQKLIYCSKCTDARHIENDRNNHFRKFTLHVFHRFQRVLSLRLKVEKLYRTHSKFAAHVRMERAQFQKIITARTFYARVDLLAPVCIVHVACVVVCGTKKKTKKKKKKKLHTHM